MNYKEILTKDFGCAMLIGANGAGKSTIFKALDFENERTMYYHPQTSFFIQSMSFRENVLYFESLQKKKVDKSFINVLKQSVLKTKASSLSGGEKQVLSILLTTMNEKKHILFDEADSDLDLDLKNNFYYTKVMEYFKKRNQKVLLITHDLHTAINHVDKIFFVNRDREIYEVGKDVLVEILKTTSDSSFVYQKLQEANKL